MKQKAVVFVLACLLSGFVFLGAGETAQEPVERRLVRWEEEPPQMVLRRDIKAIRQIMADDLSATTRLGGG